MYYTWLHIVNMKITKDFVTLKGTKKDGFILTVSNKSDRFYQDIALTGGEVLELQKILNKKFK